MITHSNNRVQSLISATHVAGSFYTHETERQVIIFIDLFSFIPNMHFTVCVKNWNAHLMLNCTQELI